MSAPFAASGGPIAPPPGGKFYHGFYWGGVGTDTHDPTEHDVTPDDVQRYEEAVGRKVAWIYFSNNWFESRSFPGQVCRWIRDLGKVPYIRLMLRSDVDQKHAEPVFRLEKIVAGDFDSDLRNWAHAAKDFGTPILVEWGTEPNGRWFSWNGEWNGGPGEGPKRYVAAYQHIVRLMREERAENLQWVWHVNWDDEPDSKWNRLENYFPGETYCEWLGVSVYGPTTPMTRDDTESFASKMAEAYPRLTRIAPGKPILVAEFGCDLHNPRVNAARWAGAALEQLFAGQWPAVIGFCWWNEGWQNDNRKQHDPDLIILHDANLRRVFQEKLARNGDKIQETPITPQARMTKQE